jgi:hypothetical protein
MEVVHLTQKQLAERWSIAEASLERWRTEGIGPTFLKLQGVVRYCIVDIEAYEATCLAESTSSLRRKSTAPVRHIVKPVQQPLDRDWRRRVQALMDDAEANQTASGDQELST